MCPRNSFEVWHLRSGVDDGFYDLTRSRGAATPSDHDPPGITQVFRDLYEPKRDFYDGPPKDRAITDNSYVKRKARYRILLHVDSQSREPFRFSQNGIAVENAETFLRGIRGDHPQFSTFTVDVDVCGDCFQLSANRSEIRDNPYNRSIAKTLVESLVESYYAQVTKIEGSVYFPCGGRYYHGMEYVLFSGNLLRACFHQSLKRFFQDQETNRQCVEAHLQAFAGAHLYCVGATRNRPISVKEIEEDLSIQEVLVVRQGFARDKPTIDETTGKRDVRVGTFMESVRAHAAAPDSLVYLPGNQDAFVLPIALKLGLSVAYGDQMLRILTIHRDWTCGLGEALPLLTGE